MNHDHESYNWVAYNLTKELGIDNWEASEGLEEPLLKILHWAKPLRSNCSPVSNSSRFKTVILIMQYSAPNHVAL